MVSRKQVTASDGEMPADLARGPDCRVWASEREWSDAGEAWGRARGLAPLRWRDWLPADVRLRAGNLELARRRHLRARGLPVPSVPWQEAPDAG